MKQQIILASKSNQRRIMMDSLGLPYVVVPAEIDEKSIRDTDLKLRAERIARAKGEKVASEHSGIIISADTFSACEGRVLEKPQSLDEAREMLRFQAKKKCVMYTGFCYIDRLNNVDYSTAVATEYEFRELSDSEIDKFINNNPVTNWAAAFALSDPYQLGFIERINGSFTGCTHGLPIELLIPCLKKSGVNL